MGLRKLPVRGRRVLAVIAGCCALAVGGVRAFFVPDESAANVVLLLLQGATTAMAWLAWHSLRPPHLPPAIDPNAKRLHW